MKLAQSCPTLCDPVDYSPPGSSISQEYWSGLPFPSSGDLPDPGIEPGSPALQADALPSEPPGKPTDTYTASRTLRLFSSIEDSHNRKKEKVQSGRICVLLSLLDTQGNSVRHPHAPDESWLVGGCTVSGSWGPAQAQGRLP